MKKIGRKIFFIDEAMGKDTLGVFLMISTRVKKKSYKEDENPFEYISIPYESLSRHITAMLQRIDDKDNEQEKDAWERIREISLKYCHEIYKRLNVKLYMEDVRGESFYRDMLPEVVDDLKELAETRISDEAVCVFPEGVKNKEGEPVPFIIRKSDCLCYGCEAEAAFRDALCGCRNGTLGDKGQTEPRYVRQYPGRGWDAFED